MIVSSTRVIAFVCVLSGLLACPGSSGPDDTETQGTTGTTGTAGTGSSSGTTGSETTTPTTGGSTGGGPAGAECGMAGGICIGQGGCADAGGSIAANSPGGCEFADGPAECCIPPAAKPGAKNCADAGGLCAPIGGCLDAGGYFTSIDKGCDFSGNFACCVPHERCGEQTLDCCTDTAVYSPACNEGEFQCMTGDPVPRGTCMPE